MYDVEVSRKAKRSFEEAEAALQRRFDRCFDQLKADPRRHANIKPLKGKLAGYFRFRVGDYRVIYRIDDDNQKVFILKIVHRSEAYG